MSLARQPRRQRLVRMQGTIYLAVTRFLNEEARQWEDVRVKVVASGENFVTLKLVKE